MSILGCLSIPVILDWYFFLFEAFFSQSKLYNMGPIHKFRSTATP